MGRECKAGDCRLQPLRRNVEFSIFNEKEEKDRRGSVRDLPTQPLPTFDPRPLASLSHLTLRGSQGSARRSDPTGSDS